MNKKYKFTGKSFQHEGMGINLHQIQALERFGNVRQGDIGGWIEKEENLSHEGNCWVYGTAWVYGNARVSGDARVSGNAQVYGDARVHGTAWVYGDARVNGTAWVFGNVLVSEDIRNSSDNLPQELNLLPESIEEVIIRGVRYKKVTVTTTKWEIV